ncbi:MAG: GNAT family N-acetyltransferase, partial [Stellaceae bacterium]
RDPNGLLIGVARSLTDFAYCCYLSDLAVDVAWQRRGIGKELIGRTHAIAGLDATLILLSAPKAMSYYPHIGLTRSERAFTTARR